jgi:MYXO-CTERM domain-containing protein
MSTRRFHPCPSVFICGFLLLLPLRAFAWEQAYTREAPGRPLHVVGSDCTQYTLQQSCSEDVGFDECRAAVDAGVQVWNSTGCSYFHFVPTAPATCCRVGYQGEGKNANCISWLEDSWPPSYPPPAIALTTITYNVADGAILDADIELNGAAFTFGTTCASGLADVQNTTAHEAGHMLGLDHSPVPGATMRTNSYAGDCELRDLSADDIEGACTIYPLSGNPGVCKGPQGGVNLDCSPPPDDCGCRAPGVSPSGSAASLAVLALLLLRLRRRRSPP